MEEEEEEEDEAKKKNPQRRRRKHEPKDYLPDRVLHQTCHQGQSHQLQLLLVHLLCYHFPGIKVTT